MKPHHHLQHLARAITRGVLVTAVTVTLSQCARETTVLHRYVEPRLGENRYVTQDGTAFGYRKWVRQDRPVDTLVIGLHGFCGASIDYENLGRHLLEKHPGVALYAYELRGQGNDPVRSRRGDIDQPDNWRRDLETFTALVSRQHPHAKIVWCGESMGALIAMRTWKNEIEAGRKPWCDALILTSPVVTIRSDFPRWKKAALDTAARILPKARISVMTLNNGQDVQMTHDSFHSEQAETNSWNVETHTLRLLSALGDMIEDMNPTATTVTVPTLVAHGGKDFFTRTEDVRTFYHNLSHAKSKELLLYPNSYHLLMYDRDRDRVISDLSTWIDSLPARRGQSAGSR